ncbi:Do family serine endopeptidase [Reinekea sp. G2M2-21]|uniref:Do family serine endopeptidase n=1 Tax=Reinekea sp. G2M2-21 TaxID=2788942 RepID=UPI0018AB14DC|nr:Do family serine endopeptidase [Reinekea sp. G2M2-21]
MLHRRFITGFLLLVLSGGVTAALPMTDSQGKPLPSLAPMLRDVNPAVVNIATYSTTQYANNPLLNDPFFRYFFDLPDASSRSPQKQQRSAGSGVIVDAQQGIVLTNFHVINGADEVQVSLIDGRSAQATVLGADPDLDIAVLQIQARPLQAVPLADSNDVQVGDFVVAIGNPFGLGQTVTTGIVSALGRSGLGIEGFENFIQTDASINPGNSGGALVNLNGELVGINTAILAPSGGNVGIGFAIPINMAKASLNQILRYGEVKRGQIGISVQDLTPMLREAFALPPGQIGVLIADVIQGSNAEQVGLQAGDIILKIDGQPVISANQLRSLFATYEIGKGMTLTVVRNGNERAVKILVEDPNQLLRLDDQLHPLLKGVTFAMNRDNRLQIDAMQPNSRAAYAGLRPGDIVLAVNQVSVKDLEQLQRVLAQAKGELLIKIARNNRAFYAVLR